MNSWKIWIFAIRIITKTTKSICYILGELNQILLTLKWKKPGCFLKHFSKKLKNMSENNLKHQTFWSLREWLLWKVSCQLKNAVTIQPISLKTLKFPWISFPSVNYKLVLSFSQSQLPLQLQYAKTPWF